jgi:hypothetical protein
MIEARRVAVGTGRTALVQMMTVGLRARRSPSAPPPLSTTVRMVPATPAEYLAALRHQV